MHMIDVMAKLKEIAESGYDNEDIQRGIDAAATQVFAEEEAIAEEELSEKRGSKKRSMQKNDVANDKEPVEEEEDAVEEDAVEEVHEDVEEDTSLLDMLKLAGRSGVIGMNAPTAIISENLELDEEEVELDEGQMKSKMIDDAESMSMEEFVEEYSAEGMSEAEAKAAYKDIMGEAIGEEAVEETVAVPVQALEELMRLAGYENYEAKIDEYENAPEPEYMDAEEQLDGLAGGLNGPKKAYPAAAGGDNAMSQEPTEVDESLEESFYSEYSKMVEELKAEDD